MKCMKRINLYVSFETCYEVASEQLFPSSIYKYNISMLLRFNDFVDQFQCVTMFFLKKTLSSYVMCIATTNAHHNVKNLPKCLIK